MCCSGPIHGAIGLAKVGLQLVGVNVDRADDATTSARRDACRACPHATRNPSPAYRPHTGLTSLSRCRLCECIISAKTRIASESCPDVPSRWDKVQVDGKPSP